MSLPNSMVPIIGAFAPVFSDRVWQHAQVLIVGAILARGKRTVTSALRACGKADERDFTTFHRVLNRARWSGLEASRILLGLLVIAFVAGGAPLIVGADDTIERRSGRKIRAKGCYRDAVRSTKKKVVHCFGLKWTSMMLLVRVPWSNRVWALPFLTVLCWPKRTQKAGKRAHRTSVDVVRQMIKQVRRWMPERAIVVVLDGGFACVALALSCVGCRVTMVSRLRLDARLFHAPGPQPASKRGPKPKKGAKQRTLKHWARRRDTPWQEADVDWYGGTRKAVLLLSRVSLWHTPGSDPVAIRWVLVRDPAGELRDEAFFTTDTAASPEQIIAWVVMRWSVEVTFEETRALMGVESQRQWSDLAIERTTPALFGLFSLVTLLAERLHQDGLLRPAQTAWYRKAEPTFSDCLSLVRQHLWRARFLRNSKDPQDLTHLPPHTLNALLDGLLAAA